MSDEIAHALGAIDAAAVQREYWRQNEFVMLRDCLPPALVARMVAEVDAVRPAAHRSYIPRHKKGGSVSYHTLAGRAPAILALYRSPAFLAFLRGVTRAPVGECPEHDPHRCALYFYTEPGDHIGFHYDTSYYRGARYTVLVGLIERSSSRLLCQPYKRVPGHPPEELALRTEPGTLVLFNGNTLWHAITPLGDGEERVSLTMEYVTDGSMSPGKRFVSNMKDAIAYFGFSAVFRGARSR
ncbi:MAG: 2OG-Fe(II) oxygenase [Candidatus Rokubacteria bacterium]|nr:2OG-Fe(II) oxygenase [Candidatus Rokubacteria bacterium]MBI3826630.1 2OG-Fe(II) oxygenase [Candidatus Rokubacteria bacterium]